MRTAPNEFEEATLGTAALRGWLIGVLAGVGIFAIVTFGAIMIDTAVAPDGLPWLIVIMLPNLAMLLLIVAIVGGIFALPSGALFWATLLFAERASLRFRTLPVWLAAGLVTAMPAAAIVWHFSFSLLAGLNSDGPPPDPFAWEHIRLPMLTLACGVIGAFFAWRARQAELAQ